MQILERHESLLGPCSDATLALLKKFRCIALGKDQIYDKAYPSQVQETWPKLLFSKIREIYVS